jgi:nitroreductase
VIQDPEEVRRLTGLVVDWMRHEAAADAPLMPPAVFGPLVAAWDRGDDLICRGAPHLIVAHVPDSSALVDGIIAITWADAVAPAFGVGTCWAGFLMIAAARWEPLREAIALPPGRTPAHALLCGYPRYRPARIPGRKPLTVTWR